MSEEIVAGEDHEEQGAEMVHEDVMQRLLAYQRQLRDGATPGEAAGAVTATKTETDMVVDLTRAEAELEAPDLVVIEEAAEPGGPVEGAAIAPVGASTDLAARVAELESTLTRVSAMIADVRDRFQDMAVDSDERLAAVSEALSKAGRTESA